MASDAAEMSRTGFLAIHLCCASRHTRGFAALPVEPIGAPHLCNLWNLWIEFFVDSVGRAASGSPESRAKFRPHFHIVRVAPAGSRLHEQAGVIGP